MRAPSSQSSMIVPELRAGEAHIWSGQVSVLHPFVPHAEAGMRHAAHGVLTRLLARYLREDVDNVRFARKPEGKPYLVDKQLNFNLSHAQGQILIGLSLCGEVGVDIEMVDDWNPSEQMWRQLWPIFKVPLVRPGFHRSWARTEAILKAWGRGWGARPDPALSCIALDSKKMEGRRVPPGPDRPVFRLWDLVSGAGTVAAMALLGEGPCQVRMCGDCTTA